MISPGRFLYLLYHKPMGSVKRSIREGGPIEQWRTVRGRRRMEAAAWQLTSIRPRDEETAESARQVAAQPTDKRQPSGARQVASATNGLKDKGTKEQEGGQGAEGERQEVRGKGTGGKPVEIHMLVGTRFWFMAAYALVSLQRQIDQVVHAHFYDDGTLGAQQRDKLETLASSVTFHDRGGIDARIERYLPEDKFPFIRERLRNYPNLKKLTDPHVGSTGPKLVMDADILFFSRPVELLQWFDAPETILCATDVTESYGYSRVLMEKLTGAPIPRDINVGITGLPSEILDWEELESWCRDLITREKTNYYLEQALVAMLCARRPFTQLGLAQYITGPTDKQVLDSAGIMQHYVDLSKKEYFRSAWRQFAASA